MSEYQYYEFLALDRALTQYEMRELRLRAFDPNSRFVQLFTALDG
jgi:hypothetical protein